MQLKYTKTKRSIAKRKQRGGIPTWFQCNPEKSKNIQVSSVKHDMPTLRVLKKTKEVALKALPPVLINESNK